MENFVAFIRRLRYLTTLWMARHRESFKKRWHWHLIFVIVLLIAAFSVITAISRAYQFWDVGSNSWFDRLKGDGWQFQRGAVSAGRDQFGDEFTRVTYLDQKWKPADSMWFYNTTQGSDWIPYDFFMALEKPGTTEPFRSTENMLHYHYLAQKPTISNPDGLPVGFVKDTYKDKEYLGFTCATCHTAQLNFHNLAIRIDGGPSGADMDSFLRDVTMALCTVPNNADIRARFLGKVMPRGHYASENDAIHEVQTYCQRLFLYNIANHSETRYGYARLDAFGRIYNRVLEHVITQEELKEQLDLTVQDLFKHGTLTQGEMDAIKQQQAGKGPLSGDQRDHLVERLAHDLPFKARVKLIENLFNRPDAPVSYPFLWDIPQHDYVQWNGIAVNAGLGSIGRNAGEAIGVFATLDWAEKRGVSLSSLISGQGIHATHIQYNSSINVHNLRLIEGRLANLQSPKWPEDILGKIDVEKAAQGERLFVTYCEGCHARIQRDDPKRRIVAHMSRVNDIKTDPQMADNATRSAGLSGILRNQYVNAGPGQVLINERAPAAALLTQATLSVVATPENKNPARRLYDWAYNLVAELLSNEIKPSLKSGNYDPDTTAQPYASLGAYKARSLNGIWATAPYLHNGSVPSLRALLLPKKGPHDPPNGEYRPDKFKVGSREFEPKDIGLKSKDYNGVEFDTSRRGNSNAGHSYGTELDPDKRDALLEYLKTL